jgi:hypothetical protein
VSLTKLRPGTLRRGAHAPVLLMFDTMKGTPGDRLSARSATRLDVMATSLKPARWARLFAKQ